MSTQLILKRIEWWTYSLAAALCVYFLITNQFAPLIIVWHYTFYLQCLSMILHAILSKRFRLYPSRIFAFVNGLFVLPYYCIHFYNYSSMREAMFMLCLMGLWQVQYTIVTGIELNELKFDAEPEKAF